MADSGDPHPVRDDASPFSLRVPSLAPTAQREAAVLRNPSSFIRADRRPAPAPAVGRQRLNVRGLNTAATLWCTAAIGVLCSMGLLLEATLGSLVVLCANILLRDIAQRLNRQDVLPASEAEQRYEVQIVCRAEDEIQVRSLMLHSLGSSDLRLQSLHSEDLDNPAKLEVRAELLGTPEAPAQLERLVSRVSLEKGVSSVRWQVFELAAD